MRKLEEAQLKAHANAGAPWQDKKAGNFPIRGFLMFRGQEIHWQILEECGDVEARAPRAPARARMRGPEA